MRNICKRYKITTERADLFDVNMTVGLAVTVKGIATGEQISSAFDHAVSCHEILCTKVVIEKDGSAYYTENQENNNQVFFSDREISVIWKEQEKRRFQVENGEYIRLFAGLQKDGFSALFLMHHLAGDGKSLSYFIETFMRALNGEQLNYYPIRRLSTDDLPKESRLPMAFKMLNRHYNRMWKREKQVFSFADMNKSFEAFWRQHETEISVRTYDNALIEKIKKEAREAGCRLTAYMITKYLQDKRKACDVGLAVDGRMDGNRSMGNQATGSSVKTKYKENRSFAENAGKIQKMLDGKLNNPVYKYFILNFMAGFEPTLVDAVNLQYAGYFDSRTSRKLADLLGYGQKTKDLSLTNLTVLDIPDCYGKYEITHVVFVPPVVSYGKNVVGIVTYKGEMNVTVHKYRRK